MRLMRVYPFKPDFRFDLPGAASIQPFAGTGVIWGAAIRAKAGMSAFTGPHEKSTSPK